ncbi:MAG: radical SAM/SPASM domain-containing protein [Planctomycetota bacterium]
MNEKQTMTGMAKTLVYGRIALAVAWIYLLRPGDFGYSPVAYCRFLYRAFLFLKVFWPNKVVRVFNGYKLHLYLPAYPTPAFFHALEGKLLRTPPGPISVLLSTTKACTYRCPHCYQSRDGTKELPEDRLIDTARRLQEKGVAFFNIEGGEPFLKFSRLENLVRAFDERAEVWVNTTGAHVTEEKFASLVKAGLFGVMVSIHSPDPEKHDAFTGVPGSFDLACGILSLCRRSNRAAAVNCVLSEAEVKAGGLDWLMELSRSLDADYVQLIHPKPAGGWMGRTEEMQRDDALIEKIRSEHLRFNGRACRAYPSLSAQVFEESEHVLGCTAGGVDRFYINAGGEVQPCEFLNVSFGNLQEEPFETIYERMRAVFSEPCSDWLCCRHAAAIQSLIRTAGIDRTPVPWPKAKPFLESLQRGEPTALYRKMGIYR